MAKKNVTPATPAPSTPPPADPAPAGPESPVGSGESPPPPASRAAPPSAPPVLTRDGIELVWSDGSGGSVGFRVEASHDRQHWTVEADLPPGTTRYAPVRRPPSNTDFYRVLSRGSDLRSNVVVIHFA